MIILRQKEFSNRVENIESIMLSIPKDLKDAPQCLQKYYKLGINKDFYKLAKLQESLGLDEMVGPIPAYNKIEEEHKGVTYRSLFSYSLDDFYLGQAEIWIDENNNLFKKSTFFNFKSFKQIGLADLRDYLKEQIIENDEVGEAWKDNKNYHQISILEHQILTKIDRI